MIRISREQGGTAKWVDASACDVRPMRETVSASVLEAVRFVMEQLPPEVRGSAWVETETGALSIRDIQVIYAATQFCRRSAVPSQRLALVPELSIDTSTWDSEGGAQPSATQERAGAR